MTAQHNPDDNLLSQIAQDVAQIKGALFGGTDSDEGFVQLTRARLKSQGNRLLRLEITAATLTGGLILLAWLFEHYQDLSTAAHALSK